MISFFLTLKTELLLNKQIKIRILILLWRLAQLRQHSALLSVLLFPVHIIYHLYSQVLLGIELPIAVIAISPIIIWHGNGIVVNPDVILGKHVVLRSGVVIGNDGVSSGCPRVHDYVEFGANSVVVGNVSIGKHSKIGPNAFVNFNVESNTKVISMSVIKL